MGGGGVNDSSKQITPILARSAFLVNWRHVLIARQNHYSGELPPPPPPNRDRWKGRLNVATLPRNSTWKERTVACPRKLNLTFAGARWEGPLNRLLRRLDFDCKLSYRVSLLSLSLFLSLPSPSFSLIRSPYRKLWICSGGRGYYWKKYIDVVKTAEAFKLKIAFRWESGCFR